MVEGVDRRLRLFLQLLAILRGHLLSKWQDQVCAFAAGAPQVSFDPERHVIMQARKVTALP
jgi:hypothetical protein